MAGSLDTPSVIWVVGDTTGRNQLGETVTISGYVYDSTEAAVDVLHDRLVASGILES